MMRGFVLVSLGFAGWLLLQGPMLAPADDGGAWLVISVVDDETGAPVPQVPVLVQNADDSSTNFPFLAGEDGVLELADVAPGRYWIAAGNGAFPENHRYALEYYEDHYWPERESRDVVTLDAGARTAIVMALAPGGRITGTVRSADTGAPVAGAHVSLRRNPDSGGSSLGTTAEDGSFTSEAQGGLYGSYYLAVAADGFAEADAQPLTIGVREQLVLDVAMEPLDASEPPQTSTTITPSTSTLPPPSTSTLPPPSTLPRTGSGSVWPMAAAAGAGIAIGLVLVSHRDTQKVTSKDR